MPLVSPCVLYSRSSGVVGLALACLRVAYVVGGPSLDEERPSSQEFLAGVAVSAPGLRGACLCVCPSRCGCIQPNASVIPDNEGGWC